MILAKWVGGILIRLCIPRLVSNTRGAPPPIIKQVGKPEAYLNRCRYSVYSEPRHHIVLIS